MSIAVEKKRILTAISLGERILIQFRIRRKAFPLGGNF